MSEVYRSEFSTLMHIIFLPCLYLAVCRLGVPCKNKTSDELSQAVSEVKPSSHIH